MKLPRYILLTWALAISTSAFGQTNLFTDGDFESAPTYHSGDVDDQGYYTQTISGTTTYDFNDWRFGRTNGTGSDPNGPRFHWFSNSDRPTWSNPPQSGNYAIQLNSDSSTDKIYVQQRNLNLTGGQTYRLSFYYIDESAFNDQVGVTVKISRNNGSSVITTADFTYTSSGTDTWQLGQISFVAPSTRTDWAIQFTDLVPSGNNQQNILLDNMSLIAVPEAATFGAAALLSGFVLVSRSRRRSQLL